jgi:hypothetical protein
MLANVLQITGAVIISAGVGLIYAPAGFIVFGALAVLFGVALEGKK